jgi:hypothetical protein
MKYILSFLGSFALLFVVVFMVTSIFIGIGSVISYLFDLTLFHSVLLCLGSSFVLSFFVFITTENRFYTLQESEDEIDELEEVIVPNNKYFNKLKPIAVLSDLSKKNRNKKK